MLWVVNGHAVELLRVRSSDMLWWWSRFSPSWRGNSGPWMLLFQWQQILSLAVERFILGRIPPRSEWEIWELISVLPPRKQAGCGWWDNSQFASNGQWLPDGHNLSNQRRALLLEYLPSARRMGASDTIAFRGLAGARKTSKRHWWDTGTNANTTYLSQRGIGSCGWILIEPKPWTG